LNHTQILSALLQIAPQDPIPPVVLDLSKEVMFGINLTYLGLNGIKPLKEIKILTNGPRPNGNSGSSLTFNTTMPINPMYTTTTEMKAAAPEALKAQA